MGLTITLSHAHTQSNQGTKQVYHSLGNPNVRNSHFSLGFYESNIRHCLCSEVGLCALYITFRKLVLVIRLLATVEKYLSPLN